MATYTPQGRAHRILERLAMGEAGLVEIGLAVDLPDRRGRRDAAWHIMGAMLRDQLIGGRRQRYYITADGGHALSVMDAGHEFRVAAPNVRVFRSEVSA